MVDRLCHTIEEQACADTACEEHRKPRGVVIFRSAALRAKSDTAILAEEQVDDEDSPGVLASDVEPGEIDPDPQLPGGELSIGLLGHHHRPHGKANDDSQGDDRDHWVEGQVRPPQPRR